MWDTKRQIIWLICGLTLGTFVIYSDARDEMGKFDVQIFAFWELVLLVIIAVMFYIYSRKKKS